MTWIMHVHEAQFVFTTRRLKVRIFYMSSHSPVARKLISEVADSLSSEQISGMNLCLAEGEVLFVVDACMAVAIKNHIPLSSTVCEFIVANFSADDLPHADSRQLKIERITSAVAA